MNVTGLQARVNITDAEGANDRLTVNALGGDDSVDASGLEAGVVALQINGGAGADILTGSQGNDLVIGGDGNDVALLGAGDDTFVWNPGDGSDTVEGQAGNDTMLFNGANVSENIDISANGERVRFFRDIANVTMDLNDVERIDFNALGGADTITVNDLSGTDVTAVNLDLGAPAARRRRGRQRHRQRHQRRRRDPGHWERGQRVRPRPGRPGQHHGRRDCQRPADDQCPGRRRRGGGLGSGGQHDPADRGRR